MPTLICDTDHVIAAAGVSKREFLERRISSILESYMDNRKSYAATNQTLGNVQPIEGIEHDAAVIYPIIASGDVMGAVVMLTSSSLSLRRRFSANKWRTKHKKAVQPALYRLTFAINYLLKMDMMS